MKTTTAINNYEHEIQMEKLTEFLNALTHGFAFMMSIFATVLLVQKSKGSPHLLYPFLIFGISLIILYAASTLFHSLIFTPAKKILQKIDHISIYVLMAGSYTPYALVAIGGIKGIILLAIIYIICLLGAIYKLSYLGKFKILETLAYIAIGWISVLYYKPLLASLGPIGVGLLILGGLAYSLGTIFYGWRNLLFHHVIWHLFVMAGSLFMFLSVYYFL
ncbi:PAQR family membrane homeostasis protein TrhA [Xylocopilactobacillus apis]|uniref:Hemolysin III family protein n=1 Tax=Xylocopilactobacillus apis TaxID=2932183 RepID=A0AAU9CZ63_9LACO|nr:hemolysin III family protein [Xylocopilactobacillus apis]BDR56533.1 hemolysin III family protein [Xylocopilactobacillus apis]